MKLTITRAYGRVDEDGSRYLLGDHMGMLHLLVLTHADHKVTGLKLELLGETSCATAISYLDSGTVFIGSAFGDSQIIQLQEERDDTGSHVKVLDRFTNLGPIVDFCVVDLERQGQGQVVTCSGAYKDGSLRIVRNGIGINEQASVELPGIRGIWSLRASTSDAFDTFLVVTFIHETRILAINMEDELEETEVAGFDAAAQTLYCGTALHDQLVHVTAHAVHLVDAITRQRQISWSPPQGMTINVVAGNVSQIVLACGGVELIYLEIGRCALTQKGHARMEHEVSCIDVTPLTPGAPAASLAAVGMWTDISVRVFRLPGLERVASEPLAGEVIPRSVLLCRLEKTPYLLVAMGDGQLFNFVVDEASGALSERKRVSLGTQPISLRCFQSKGATHVFASSDRPTVVYASAAGKLLYSSVNLREVTHMCPFNSASFPESLAIGSEGGLAIGGIDDIQKLHIRSVPLGEQPRRIAHMEGSRTLGVLTIKHSQSPNGDDQETHFVRLLDDQTMETLHHYQLEQFENGCSIISCSFADDPTVYYCVGTAMALPEESEPTQGRILILAVEGGKLTLVAEKETKGAVYNLNAFNGKLLAGINSKIQLYKWMQGKDGVRELTNEAGHHGHVLAVYVQTRGDFIVVGDIMKSISLLMYKPEESAIEERAKDYNANWMCAVEVLDDDTYLGAENSFNLFTVRKNSDAATDEERSRLEVVGEYHLGEFVNRFRHGSLVMRLPDSEASNVPTVIYGTVSGVIGVIASLPQAQFEFLERLQNCITKHLKGVGGLSHAEWRSFHNDRKTTDAHNFLDGDLIESFLDLKREQQALIADEMKTSLEELHKRVEEMSRLH
eukprot:jgi/Mesvir1/4952/Mv04573-RA.2